MKARCRAIGVRVSTELVRAGNEPTPVEYWMRNVNGQWKIFDVNIEGISYVQTFRNQFDTPLRQKGIKQVASELHSGSMQAGPRAMASNALALLEGDTLRLRGCSTVPR